MKDGGLGGGGREGKERAHVASDVRTCARTGARARSACRGPTLRRPSDTSSKLSELLRLQSRTWREPAQNRRNQVAVDEAKPIRPTKPGCGGRSETDSTDETKLRWTK